MAPPAELPKGLKLLLGMIGITPEMLQNPGEILKQFGINPADVKNVVAEFQQIGLSVDRRLSRIEAHLGIVDADPGRNRTHSQGDGGELSGLGKRPPNQRN